MEMVTRIIIEISERENVEFTDLPPLREAIDPDALQSLIESPQDDGITINFTYYGYDITVSGNGSIEVDDVIDRQPQIADLRTNDITG